MKYTQIDWCPIIPDNWGECRIKDVARLQSGNGISANDIDTQGEYPVYGGNGLRGYTSIYTNVGSYVLIGRQGALCGNINYAQGKFYATEHAVVCYPYKPDEVTKWFGETLRCADLNRLSATAAQPGLSVAVINNQFIPYPPDNERRLIADYLDTKTAAIDKRIAVLEKKQEVYSRLRRSIINRAVTRGLTPDVPLKDSGVDWIGMIPEHWEVRRMKDVISFTKGKTPTELTMECNGLPYLNMDYLRSREGKVTFYPEHTEGLFAIDENEILVLWDGANAGEFILSKKGYLGSTMALLSVNGLLMDKRYLYALLKGIENTSKYFANGTTIPHFDSNVLMGYSYPIPPLPEQLAIASYLDEKCTKIDAAVANIGKQIDALKRLKRALINEVVTGKRKV